MQSQDDILTRLWSAAHAMFQRMRAAIGDTEALAARRRLAAEESRAVRKWLGPLEAMVRKVVLVHALTLVESGAARSKRGDTHARTAPAELPTASAMRVCHPEPPAAPPAVTLIALAPPPVHFVTQATAAAATAPAARARAPSLRLWPRTPASAGPRVRDVGPNLLVRDVQRDVVRLAAARSMAGLRRRRRSAPARLARRIDALSRIIDRPLPAARRLARTLAARPQLAIRLAARRPPRTRLYVEPECALAHTHAFNRAYDWSMRIKRDTS